jgi:hypothetical protein
MRPVKPAAATEIRHELGGEMLAYAGEALEYVSISGASVAWDVNALDLNGTAQHEVELVRLPANDPSIAFVELGILVRTTTTAGSTLYVRHGDNGDLAGGASVSGTSGRGGAAGPIRARVGGTNGRSILWNNGSHSSPTQSWLYVFGYWRRVGA